MPIGQFLHGKFDLVRLICYAQLNMKTAQLDVIVLQIYYKNYINMATIREVVLNTIKKAMGLSISNTD